MSGEGVMIGYAFAAGVGGDPITHHMRRVDCHIRGGGTGLVRGLGRRAGWLEIVVVAALVVIAVCGVCRGQGQVGEARGHRLVHRFDFEEARLNNFEDLPKHWFVIGRPADTASVTFLRQPLHQKLIEQTGFPRYGTVRFDRPQTEKGGHHLHVALNGGNAGAFLEVGALPAVPGSEYLITAKVRTRGLKHAAARVVVYFVDGKGNRVEASVSGSGRVQTGGRWETVSVRLRGLYPEAAWIGIEALLEQAKPDDQSPLGRQQVVYRDVHGEAGFDDIMIWQLPLVTVRTQNPVNVIRSPQKPELSMRVRDLTGRELIAQLVVYDHLYRVAGTDRQAIGNGLPSSWTWQPRLARYGWYLVDMTIFERGLAAEPLPVARTLSSLLWLPEKRAVSAVEGSRFMVSATGVEGRYLGLIPQVVTRAGLGAVVLSAWGRDTGLEEVERRQVEVDGAGSGAHVRG